MLTPEEKAKARAEFDRTINMSAEEMQAHYSSPASDFASLDPKIAAKLKKRSGKTQGKEALALKVKETWDDADYAKAQECTSSIKRFLGRKVAYANAEGAPTPFAVSLMNRGHDPAKVQPEAEQTLREYEDAVREAVRDHFRLMLGAPLGEEYGPGPSPWTKDIRPASQTVIVEFDGSLFQFSYVANDTGGFTLLPDMIEVRVETNYVPVVDLDDSVPGEVVDVAEAVGEDGPVWTVYMIKAGTAKGKADNGYPCEYTEDALKVAVAEGLFDNVKGYQRTDAEHRQEKGTVEVGSMGKAVWDPIVKGVKNTFTWIKDKYPALIHTRLTVALASKRPDLMPAAFSITGDVLANKNAVAGKNVVTKILEIRSCDPVSFPSAGGDIIAVSESTKENSMKIKVTEALAAKGVKDIPPKLQAKWEVLQVEEGAAADFMIGQLKEKRPKMFEAAPDLETQLAKNEVLLIALFSEFMSSEGVEPAAPADAAVDPTKVAAAEAAEQAQIITSMRESAIDGILAKSSLSVPGREQVKRQLAGQTFSVIKVQEAVRTQIEYEASVRTTTRESVAITADASDKLQEATNGFFFQDIPDMGQRRKVRESYGNIISENPKGQVGSFRELFRMLFPNLDPSRSLIGVTEAMDTALATKLLTNGINARLAYEYALASAYESWRSFCNVVPVYDYQTKTAMTYGGFSGWSTNVTKSTDFPDLTDTGSQAEQYAVTRKGGILTISEIDIRNDNVGYVLALPRRLANEAKRRLSAMAWALITANPTMATDSVAVFNAAHSNLMTDPLADAALSLAIGMLQAQTHPNATDKLVTRPAFLATSADMTQQKAAYGLITPAAAQLNDVASFSQAFGIKPLVNPHTTDTDDWYLFGDKNEIGIVEIGMLDGQETPEVATSQLEGVGAWFLAGDAKWRVKQAYSGNIVDYRGVVASLVP